MKIKKQVMDKLLGLLPPGETVEAAVSFGKIQFRPGAVERPQDRDYALVTGGRMLVVKGEWFVKKTGVSEFRRDAVRSAAARHFVLGCTVTIAVAADGIERELIFENCGKPEGEALVKALTGAQPETPAAGRCPRCDRALNGEFSFCPYCNAALKLLCSNCGKPLQPEWKNCPFCGKG